MRKAIKFERSFAANDPMPPDELASAERILARLVAEAFAADHPELFADRRPDVPIMANRLEGCPTRKDRGDQGMTTAGEIYARIE